MFEISCIAFSSVIVDGIAIIFMSFNFPIFFRSFKFRARSKSCMEYILFVFIFSNEVKSVTLFIPIAVSRIVRFGPSNSRFSVGSISLNSMFG